MKKEEFRRIREDLGVSRPKLAKKLGVSVSTIERYENEKCPIPEPISICMKNFDFNNVKKLNKKID
jgi:transcriptional regulator with XRE-family HTH domain